MMKFIRPVTFIAAAVSALIPFVLAQGGAPFSLGSKLLKPRVPPVQTANATGKFNVGVRRETYDFSTRELNVSYWYPALLNYNSTTPRYISGGGIIGGAALNTSIDHSSGPYPLILFSPGDGAHDDAYYFYLQNLASHGYIVASINHWDATECGITSNLVALGLAMADKKKNNTDGFVELLYSSWFRETQFALTYRSQEIEYILNQTLAKTENEASFLYASIDIGNIGLSGHSLGAFYTLIKGGGFAINCHYPLSPLAADIANPIITEVSICAFPEAKSLSSPTALYDARFKAALALAPPFFNLDGTEIAEAASSIVTPLMIITGNDPSSESNLESQKQAYDGSPGAKYMVEVAATDHLLVSEAYQFNENLSAHLPKADLADFIEKAEVYMTYSSAFFDLYLKQDCASKETLHEYSSTFVANLEFSD